MSAVHAGRGIPVRGVSCTYKLEARALPRALYRALYLSSNRAGHLRSSTHNARPTSVIAANDIRICEVLLSRATSHPCTSDVTRLPVCMRVGRCLMRNQANRPRTGQRNSAYSMCGIPRCPHRQAVRAARTGGKPR